MTGRRRQRNGGRRSVHDAVVVVGGTGDERGIVLDDDVRGLERGAFGGAHRCDPHALDRREDVDGGGGVEVGEKDPRA